MRKRTTTGNLKEVIVNELLQVTSAEIYNKFTQKTETIDAAKFREYFTKLCESGIFADALGWHYEKDHTTGNYAIETGRLNLHSDIVIIAHLSVNDSANDEEIENLLHMEESEE